MNKMDLVQLLLFISPIACQYNDIGNFQLGSNNPQNPLFQYNQQNQQQKYLEQQQKQLTDDFVNRQNFYSTVNQRAVYNVRYIVDSSRLFRFLIINYIFLLKRLKRRQSTAVFVVLRIALNPIIQAYCIYHHFLACHMPHHRLVIIDFR